jgi:hypothetical protein
MRGALAGVVLDCVGVITVRRRRLVKVLLEMPGCMVMMAERKAAQSAASYWAATLEDGAGGGATVGAGDGVARGWPLESPLELWEPPT